MGGVGLSKVSELREANFVVNCKIAIQTLQGIETH
jgi:hypothetical protein